MTSVDALEPLAAAQQLLAEAGDPGRAQLAAAQVVLLASGPLGTETTAILGALGLGELTITTAEAFTGGDALDLVLDADVLVDVQESEATRFHANDIAAVRGIPLVWASAGGRWGRVGVASDEVGIDYRDLAAGDADVSAGTVAPVASEALPRLVARVVAAELLRLVTGAGEPLLGRVAVIDGRSGAVRELAYRRADGIRPGSIEEKTRELETSGALSMDALELAAELDSENPPLLIDVRDPHEHSYVSIPGSELVPLRALILGIENLDHEANIVLYCHHGARSGQALATMRNLGFTNVRHLAGGIDAYSRIADPGLPRY